MNEQNPVKALVTFRVFRYPGDGSGEKPRFAEYKVDVNSDAFVLDVLDRIKEKIDPSLTYRSSCHHGVCGSCTTRINGIEAQTCKKRVSEVADGANVVTIEPMRNFRVIRDLVVDMKPFFQKIKAVEPGLVTGAEDSTDNEILQSRKNLELTLPFEACIECGACYSACPIVSSDPGYLGPAALVAAYRSSLDDRDRGKSRRLSLVDDEEGVWRCHQTFNCTDVCPVNVKPELAIAGLRRMVMSARLKSLAGRREDR